MAKPYTFPSRPNPQVYRLAAQYICQKTFGYCCPAIKHAAMLDGCNRLERELYVAQFRSVFAFVHGEPPLVPMWCDEVWGDYRDQVCASVHHPFWNKHPAPKRQEMRVLALLFMADICENPT